jgi:hypothetical protein
MLHRLHQKLKEEHQWKDMLACPLKQVLGAVLQAAAINTQKRQSAWALQPSKVPGTEGAADGRQPCAAWFHFHRQNMLEGLASKLALSMLRFTCLPLGNPKRTRRSVLPTCGLVPFSGLTRVSTAWHLVVQGWRRRACLLTLRHGCS